MKQKLNKLLDSFEKAYCCSSCDWYYDGTGKKLTIITDPKLKKTLDDNIVLIWQRKRLYDLPETRERAYCLNGCWNYFSIDLESGDLLYLGQANFVKFMEYYKL
jgi:hypothetical protein